MSNSTSASSGTDLIDQLVGLVPGSATHGVRHRRDKVVQATQGSYEALFDPALPGLSLAERLLVALYACRLTPAPALAVHYQTRLEGLAPDPSLQSAVLAAALAAVQSDAPAGVSDRRLRAMLEFTRVLILKPIEGDRALLETLPAAGISTPAIVALSQLIAFLSYQTRLVAGLAAMRAAVSTSPGEAKQ